MTPALRSPSLIVAAMQSEAGRRADRAGRCRAGDFASGAAAVIARPDAHLPTKAQAFAPPSPSLHNATEHARLRESGPFPENRATPDSLARLGGGALIARRAGLRPVPRARRAASGRERAHHLYPRARRLARHGGLDRDRGGEPDAARLAAPARRGRGARHRRARRRIHRHLPRHRLALGPADLGHLLGMGRADDLDAGPAVPLSRLSSRSPAPSGRRTGRGG